MSVFVGLDWGSAEHAVCVVDGEGASVAKFTIKHSAKGLESLLARLAGLGPSKDSPIAIERPSGLLVDTLVEAGHPIVPIHPNALKACRPRYTAAGGKSDPGDAYILADVLRTDGHRFRALKPTSDQVRALRALVRGRDNLVWERVALANQLTALLERFWPGAGQLFCAIDSQIALAFLKKYPTPSHAKHLGAKRMEAFLARHSYTGRKDPAELLERLRAAAGGLVGPAEEHANGEAVLDLVCVLEALLARIQRATAAVEHAVAQIPANQLAAEAGVAPVTYSSGKSRGVRFRYACNKRLRTAITIWADNSRHASPWAKQVYERARARGCRHQHATRILARAWLRVLWRCWTDGVPYDPDQHGAAKGLTPSKAA